MYKPQFFKENNPMVQLVKDKLQETSIEQYKNEEPFFQRRSFQFNPDAFEMFLVANKKQGIKQKDAISQAFFLYAYLYLTKEEFENIELVSPTEFSFLKSLELETKETNNK
jgi:hypothetical protein